QAILIASFVIAPLLVSAKGGPQTTAIAGGYALVLSIVLGTFEMHFLGADHLLHVAVVLAGGLIAIWIASLRARAEQTEARSMFIAEAGTRLDTSLDFETTVETLAKLAIPRLGDWCAVYWLEDDGSIKM